MRAWMPVLAVASLACLASAKERELRGRPVKLSDPPRAQLADHRPVRELAGEIRLGDAAFPVDRSGSRPRVATSPGGSVSTTVSPGKTVSFRWEDGDGSHRKTALRFVEEDGRWGYHAGGGFRYRLADEEIVLVDLDADGRFEVGKDGFRAGDGEVASPLAADLVLGRSRVRLVELAADGSRLRVDVEPLSGTDQQIDTLLVLNRLRLRNGLLPVDLDADLSAACTSHARYLQANRWDSSTNPHFQNLGPEGATPEGAAAAKRSIIQAIAPQDAVLQFFRTYYHRVPMMDASLSRVGINAEPPSLAILDVADRSPAGAAPAWSDPCFVPADGATDFPVAAVSEKPRDPVPDMQSRGCPLMMYVPYRASIAEFRAEVVALAGRRETPVEVLVADRTDAPNVCGVVPVKPLRGGTWHRITWTYVRDGEKVRHVTRFRTE